MGMAMNMGGIGINMNTNMNMGMPSSAYRSTDNDSNSGRSLLPIWAPAANLIDHFTSDTASLSNASTAHGSPSHHRT